MDERIHAGDGCNLSSAQREAIAHLVTGIWMVASAFGAAAADAGGYYTTHDMPPGIRRRETFHERVRAIESARKVGRTWIVPRDDWHKTLSAPKARVAIGAAPAVNDSVDAILATRGVRLRGGRAA